MTKEQLMNFADVIVAKYSPQSKTAADYDLKYSIYENKLADLRDMILNFPDGIEMEIKEEVATDAINQLKSKYIFYTRHSAAV